MKTETHIGRSWGSHPLEDECSCPKGDCGLVIRERRDPTCEQHHPSKTIRQSHLASECPACSPLRETVARALFDFDLGTNSLDTERDRANVALVALGLDDLDAAVTRGAGALDTGNAGARDWRLRSARLVLEAALTATDAKGSTDG